MIDSVKPILCFGELLLRFTPPDRDLLFHSRSLDVHVGGAEANVAVGLASLGYPARIVSVLPDNAAARHIVAELRAAGVDTSKMIPGSGRVGVYFVGQGAGVRPPDVLYDREGSAFAQAAPKDFNWPDMLAGAGGLHLSGIVPALGPKAARIAIEAVQAASGMGLLISFDGNYRTRLWAERGAQAAEVLQELVGHCDILFGGDRDIALLTDRPVSNERQDRRAAAELAFEMFPRLNLIARTFRATSSASEYTYSARIDDRVSGFESEDVQLSGVVERIGAGDAFVAGVLYGLRSPNGTLESATRTGLGLACLKHFTPGDASRMTMTDVDAFWRGERDVRR